jgi:Protein of unknown function (DUF1838)
MSQLPHWLRHTLQAPDASYSGNSKASSSGLDFENPLDNLYAFGKLWASYDDVPAFSAFHGTMFGMVGSGRLKPLFGYTGFGGFQSKLLDNSNVRLRGKETGFFTDLATGDILEHWDNPYTGETVEVFNFFNDQIRGELSPVMPVFHFGDSEDAPTLMNDGSARVLEDGSVPFILPWERYNDQVLLSWDYTHHYRNPVTADKWPAASTGEFINPSEHFTFSTEAAELEDRSNPSARYNCGFTRLSPWWPWMKMGKQQPDGVLFGRMHSHKRNNGFGDIPPKVLAYCEKHHPEYLEPCTDWNDGFPIGTWEAYAREVPPEQ